MHIHANSMNLNAANFYSVGNGEKSAAAEVRKRLLKSATSIDAVATPEETLMIGQWLDSRYSQLESATDYHTAAAGRDLGVG